MVQSGQDLHLGALSRHGYVVADAWMEDLDGDLAAEELVAPAVDLGRRAATQQRIEAVAAVQNIADADGRRAAGAGRTHLRPGLAAR